MKPTYLLLAAVALSIGSAATADNRRHHEDKLFAVLKGTNETPAAITSLASGSFFATWDEDSKTLTYELSYKDLEAPPTQAHIHVGQKGVSGGISLWLCGNPPTVPAAPIPPVQTCPAAPATITGTLTVADIAGPAGQGIAPTTATANDLPKLINAVRNGITYANVHTGKYAAGEIRGQVRVLDGRRRH